METTPLHPEQEATFERLAIHSASEVISKSEVKGSAESQPPQDVVIDRADLGLFVAIDGVGGNGGGDLAAESIKTSIENGVVSGSTLLEATRQAERDLKSKANNGDIPPDAGAVLSGVMIDTVTRAVETIHLGDTRILLKRNDEDGFTQITKDEGHANFINNGILANHTARYDQTSSFLIEPGDQLLIFTDGICGDFEPDFLSDETYLEAFSQQTPAEAVDYLLYKARKKDDRGIIAVFIEDQPLPLTEEAQHTTLEDTLGGTNSWQSHKTRAQRQIDAYKGTLDADITDKQRQREDFLAYHENDHLGLATASVEDITLKVHQIIDKLSKVSSDSGEYARRVKQLNEATLRLQLCGIPSDQHQSVYDNFDLLSSEQVDQLVEMHRAKKAEQADELADLSVDGSTSGSNVDGDNLPQLAPVPLHPALLDGTAQKALDEFDDRHDADSGDSGNTVNANPARIKKSRSLTGMYLWAKDEISFRAGSLWNKLPGSDSLAKQWESLSPNKKRAAKVVGGLATLAVGYYAARKGAELISDLFDTDSIVQGGEIDSPDLSAPSNEEAPLPGIEAEASEYDMPDHLTDQDLSTPADGATVEAGSGQEPAITTDNQAATPENEATQTQGTTPEATGDTLLEDQIDSSIETHSELERLVEATENYNYDVISGDGVTNMILDIAQEAGVELTPQEAFEIAQSEGASFLETGITSPSTAPFTEGIGGLQLDQVIDFETPQQQDLKVRLLRKILEFKQ
ncbi:TPA: hypothetical protein EYO12_00305 [Candidatus Saccharibacteria bacterium]|nr:hypothetical protein [Candidatus Saccharibacteria bacterium]HIO87239.1 hypothetical protein [Candidatus Saccharibacteria bacterium]